jgi:protoporphyrinogen oxidase
MSGRDLEIAILGAGPAGLGAAFELHRKEKARAVVLEQKSAVGGNAGSFEIAGQRVDYGSHRLHPACDEAILSDIAQLLDGDLLERPRHGRIRLRGRWIHFPLKPIDLMLRLDPGFALGTARDMLFPGRPARPAGDESFASVLQASLGSTICSDFYFPYARKIWGVEPHELSAVQARRRVAANSFGKLVRKVLGRLPGVKPIGFSHYFYPRRGFGSISEAYAEAAAGLGARLELGTRVERLTVPPGPERWEIEVSADGVSRSIGADWVWSTLPISLVARMASPSAPQDVLAAADRIDYRAMILVYITLGVDRYTEYDAHYFPESSVAITRLSETKNYAELIEPAGRTTLCAELPCSPGDGTWESSDDELVDRLLRDLRTAALPEAAPLLGSAVRRLRHAYPIYRSGYEKYFGTLDGWVGSLPRLLSFGRQGLFAHDNTHHALYMAYSAADCLEGGTFDWRKWADYRAVFETHVVED